MALVWTMTSRDERLNAGGTREGADPAPREMAGSAPLCRMTTPAAVSGSQRASCMGKRLLATPAGEPRKLAPWPSNVRVTPPWLTDSIWAK